MLISWTDDHGETQGDSTVVLPACWPWRSLRRPRRSAVRRGERFGREYDGRCERLLALAPVLVRFVRRAARDVVDRDENATRDPGNGVPHFVPCSAGAGVHWASSIAAEQEERGATGEAATS